jgi:midasin
MADFLWSTLESIPSPLRTNIPLLISRLDSPLTLPQNLTNPLLLQHLSRLLTIPALTRHIADIARPLLLDLCARWIDDESIGEFERFEAIAFLIGVHREIYP